MKVRISYLFLYACVSLVMSAARPLKLTVGNLIELFYRPMR